MSINWHDLRSLNGSQNAAFEELCCQLAGAEAAPHSSLFIRKGAPDAGVECYWKLPDGSEWGWQAKFFLSPPGSNQWAQIDESVKTALEKHPQLSRYVACLPIDRQDPRVDGQQWFLDKWNEHVQVWEGWAIVRGMAVTFEYWGAHELLERLSREEHRGRYYFWFHRDLFSQEWFHSRIEEAIANVGPRYSPELDVQLPIARLFHGLGRTPEFYTRVMGLLKGIRKTLPRRKNTYLPEKSQQLSDVLDRLWKLLEPVQQKTVERIDWNGIRDVTRAAIEVARECEEALAILIEGHKHESRSKEEKDEIDQLKYLVSDYWHLSRELVKLQEYALSDEAGLSNVPALLLVGEAGRGKTHLFCDIVRHRIDAGMPTVLLIGGQFNSDEPWVQITRLLGLSCTREEFLGAFEAAAQARGTRAVILIDALNEGEGKVLWKKHLAGILLTVSKSPWLGIAVSVRTSYKDMIRPQGLVPSRLVQAEHYGFADHEYEATKTFFEFFGIQRPSVPLLVPEFQNPLFLKIFCQGLKNNHLTSILPGLQGITSVFKFFIDSVNKKLSDAEYLDFNSNLPIIWRAVEAFAAQLAERGRDWLPLEEAQGVINQILPRDGHQNSLFRHLVGEGVIAENRFYVGDNQWSEGVQFAYDRFTDHLIAKYLLDVHLNTIDPASSFMSDNPLAKYVNEEHACARNRGLIEAFTIQVPERIGKELIELIPSIQAFDAVISAFIESIIWRRPHSINLDVALDYINASAIHDSYHHDRLLNALLTVAANHDHPLNADLLHQNLLRLELPERDSWWSIFLSEQYSAHGAVDRLVDWAWSPEDKAHIADESVRLCGIALAWLLTTSNRFLRDRATKALVRLFTHRIKVLRTVIQAFVDVNDPYVFERLMAVACGCSMRSEDTEAIGGLAADIYAWVFRDGHPPVHILARDYALGVIEVAVHRGIALDIDLSKVRPPYASTFPDNIPTEEELKGLYDNFDAAKRDIDDAQSAIWLSVMNGGDFARYVIGTNSGSFEWSSRRLGAPSRPTRKKRYEAFTATLTPRQRSAVERYRAMRNIVAVYSRLNHTERRERYKVELTDEQLNKELQAVDERLRKQLGKKKSAQLSDDIMCYIENPDEDEFRFDLSLAQRWILQRVFELGWTLEKFGRFDRYITYQDMRDANKPERIAKKYQWIAYHEFLARVADNFEFRGEDWYKPKVDKYDGPWQGMSLRDIDPSWVLPKTKQTSSWDGFEPTWWAPAQVQWDPLLTDTEWIRNSADLPAVEPLIAVIDPRDNSHWLTLKGSYRWEHVNDGDNGDSPYPKRTLQYSFQSYIVKQADAFDLFEWMKTQWRDTRGFSLRDSNPVDCVFFGEFCWAPAFLYQAVPYYSRDGWVGGKAQDTIPKPILLATDQYAQEDRGFDCSIDKPTRVYLPCQWIAEGMNLRWRGIEGYFYDAAGNLIAFDPSVNSAGPGALLINRKLFLKYLNENGYTLLWRVIGEKLIITGNIPGDDWPGRLDILGVFCLQQQKIDGKLYTRLSE